VQVGLDDLSRCVGNPDVFASEIWGVRPLHRTAEDDHGFEDLLSLDDVDQIVSSMGLRLPAFRLVRNGTTLSSDSYTKTTRTGSQSAAGVMDANAVFREFAEGATIVFQGMHRYWFPLARFCRHLEQTLGHPVQANAYVTPPGSQGLSAHEDEHDVFVLQANGTKEWRVYQQHDLPPSRPPLVDAAVGPGDSLYIPRGFPHAASTQAQASVHITIGILSITWASALHEAAKLAEREPSLGEPLPLRYAQRPGVFRELVQERLAEIGGLVAKADAATIAERLRRRLLTTRQPILRGQIHQILALGDLSDRSKVRLQDGAMCTFGPVGGDLSVLLADRELRMPGWLEPAIEHIVSRERLGVDELSPYLDEPGRMVLVRRLIMEGLLEVDE
jgi:hypothetical protein